MSILRIVILITSSNGLTLSLTLGCMFHRGEDSLYLYLHICAQETLGPAHMGCAWLLLPTGEVYRPPHLVLEHLPWGQLVISCLPNLCLKHLQSCPSAVLQWYSFLGDATPHPVSELARVNYSRRGRPGWVRTQSLSLIGTDLKEAAA